MGIHGIFKEIGQGQRVSLIKLASDHFVNHERPLRLAIDISIWLFQIQAGKGGSNPALRTFYYRLLRLLSFNIHPLFVFDGPNKPLFKRNKKVGGPGVRVASVPEFLAKQLLKQFGFPWHVAPGEAEAECALLQRERIVDAVLSEDVDTLMFGSGVTMKNWSPENTSKVPTHVNVYRAEETKEKSGMDREGMILVALMSGGDYIPEGIPGCGPKLACDAARAGYGKELVELARKKDTAGLTAWRERMQHQIRTNEDKIFSRRNTKLVIPDDFPNQEVLGYYTHPCVSTADKLSRLRAGLKWDQDIDFPALRSFASDAFDWRCLGGAKKFIRNMAPAMLVRQLRLLGDEKAKLDTEAQDAREKQYVSTIHGKRNHKTTDCELEYRLSYIPMNLVPIDLSIEDDDDDFIPAGGIDEQSEAESDFAIIPSSTADEEDDALSSPKKKRTAKPYEPDQPEKIWMLHSFLKVGCPLLVEDYEASFRDPKAALQARRKARAGAATGSNIHAKKTTKKKKVDDKQQNALLQYTTVIKSSQMTHEEPSSSQESRPPLEPLVAGENARGKKTKKPVAKDVDDTISEASGFRTLSTQLPSGFAFDRFEDDDEETPKASRRAALPNNDAARPFAAFAKKAQHPEPQKTPRRKRRSADAVSPAVSQKSIRSYFSPTPRKAVQQDSNIINLVSSSPVKPDLSRASTPTPKNRRSQLSSDLVPDMVDVPLLDSVTKRRKKAPLKRHRTAPIRCDDDDLTLPMPRSRPATPEIPTPDTVDAMDLASPAFSTDMQSSRINFPVTKPHPTVADVYAGTAKSKPAKPTKTSSLDSMPLRPSPVKQQPAKKKRIQPRESLPGAWKEVDAEILDLSGDGSGWKATKGRATLTGWRKSGVEVLDLTGA